MIEPPDGHVDVLIDLRQGDADLQDSDVGALLTGLRSGTSSLELCGQNPRLLTTGGPGEVGLLVALSVFGAAYLKRFAELLADDTHTLIVKGINKLRHQRSDKSATIRFGSLDFHISGSASDNEVRSRLVAAAAIVRSAPDQVLERPYKNLSGPAIELELTPGFIWDERRGIWIPDRFLQEEIAGWYDAGQ